LAKWVAHFTLNVNIAYQITSVELCTTWNFVTYTDELKLLRVLKSRRSCVVSRTWVHPGSNLEPRTGHTD
jgi:hypothetical protein